MINKKKIVSAQQKAEVKKTTQTKSTPKKAAPRKAAPKKGNGIGIDKVAKNRKTLTTTSDAKLSFFKIHKVFGAEFNQASKVLTTTYRAWCYREERFIQDAWTDESTAIAAAQQHSNTALHPSTVMVKRRN